MLNENLNAHDVKKDGVRIMFTSSLMHSRSHTAARDVGYSISTAYARRVEPHPTHKYTVSSPVG